MCIARSLRILPALVIVAVLLSLSGAAAGMAVAAPPSPPQPAVAPNVGADIAISARTSAEYSPAIAYNARHDEYLVVWENIWPGGHHDIYAQRVTSDGRLLSWFAVASGSHSQMTPSVAYDPVNDRYLVVWVYDVFGNGSDWDVWGRFIPWDGPSASLLDLAICSWSSNQAHPVVAYGRAQEEFLVVWMNAPAGQPSYISARRVFADASGFAPDDGFTVSSGPQKRDFPDVAYNLARNEYLVVWDVETSGSGLDIYGSRLSGEGIALAGGEFGIAGWPALEERPSVAACASADQYLVAWQSDKETSGTDYAIYARYLNGAAVPGNVYLVADTTSPQVEAHVSCDANRRRYLLAWQDRYANLKYGISASHAYPNESISPNFAIVAPGPGADRLVPAIGGGGSNYLVAWEHQTDGGADRDIHGRLVGYFTHLPLLLRGVP